MVAQGRLVGLVALPGRPGDEDYQVHELQLLTIVAGQVALQIENTRLYEEEVAKQKLEEEMAMARADPDPAAAARTCPPSTGVQIDAVNISSKQVSGDYYDMIEREDGRLGIIIADVSGKGMPASILASNLQAALRAQCDTCDSPGRGARAHQPPDPRQHRPAALRHPVPGHVRSAQARRLRYSSGGHNAPVADAAPTAPVELLEKGGLPLGAFDFGTYEEATVTLRARRPAVHVHRRPDRDQGPRRRRGLRRGAPERPAAAASATMPVESIFAAVDRGLNGFQRAQGRRRRHHHGRPEDRGRERRVALAEAASGRERNAEIRSGGATRDAEQRA